MSKMIILRGVSGSGKSTWARMFAQNTGAIVVSRDDIRKMLFGSDGPDYYAVDKDVLRSREEAVTVARDAQIAAFLRAGYDIIADDTNIEWKYVRSLARIANRCGAEVEIKTFDVRLPVAIAADKHRGEKGGRCVGEVIIRKQHQRFQGNKDNTLEPTFVPTPYHGTPGKPKAFLVDVDGTLAHMDTSPGGRGSYREGAYAWHRVGEDFVDEVISDIVRVLSSSNFAMDLGHYEVIVMSGRDSSCWTETVEWLDKHNIPFDHLFMRPEKDMRPDNIVKAELFDKHIRDNFDVQFVLDDRQQVVDMWRSMGLTCLQVAEGNF